MRNVVFAWIAGAVLIFLLHGVGFADLTHSLSFSSDDLSFSKDGDYDVVKLKGCEFSTDEIGAPDLPVKVVSFVIPQNEKVDSITILSSTSEQLSEQYYIIPSQPPAKTDGSEPPPFVPPDPVIYSSLSSYPGGLAAAAGSGYRSEFHLVTVRFFPLQYVPADRKLTLYTYVSFVLKTSQSGDRPVPVYRRSELSQAVIEKVVESLVENPGDVRSYGGHKMIVAPSKKPEKLNITSLPSLEGHCVDCAIITSEDLKEELQRSADWKTQKGAVTVVRTIPWIDAHYQGCDLQERIRNFIKDAYSSWGTIWVLLGGDTRIIPDRKACSIVPADLYYSDLDRNWNADGDAVFAEYSFYEQLAAVDFTDQSSGWTVGRWGQVGHTTNAGVKWEPQITEIDVTLCGTCFLDAQCGWASGQIGTIINTANGGESWVPQESGVTVTLYDIDFVDPYNGWAVGDSGTVLYTTNGGVAWAAQTSGVNYPLIGLCFADAQHGWAVGFGATILYTADAGTTWTLCGNPGTSHNLYDVTFADLQNGWAVGELGTIVHSTDGGLNWIPQESTVSERLTGLSFVDQHTGWAVGGMNAVLHTVDAGTTWVAQETGMEGSKIADVVFVTAQDGWAVGYLGSTTLIIRTSDGGSTWQRQYISSAPDHVDLNPDLCVGRAPAENAAEANVFIDKLFTYEKEPPTEYLNKILFMAADLGGSYYAPLIQKEEFQQKDWYVNSTLASFTKCELYNPIVDPDPSHIPPWWEGDALLNRQTALDSLNAGYHFINHMDHSGAYAMGTGNRVNGGAMVKEDIVALTNGSQYSIVWTYGCSPNAFHYESISEAFINNPNGGGVAFIGNTMGGEPAQAAQDYQFFESLFGDSLHHIGQAFATTQGLPFHNYKSLVTNLLGDPEMPVWTDEPAELIVTHPDTIEIGPCQFTVLVQTPATQETLLVHDPVPNALVCLQKGMEAYGRGFTDANGEITFDYEPETPGSLTVTVTKMNFIPYEGTCTVIPIADPYIYYESHTVNDDNLGNGDSIVNPGETIELPVTLRNSGAGFAGSVSGTLSTSDGYTILLVEVQSFGDILPESTATSLGPYLFTILPDRPDTLDPEIPFSLKITCSSGDTWRDDFLVPLLSDSLYHTCHRADIADIQPNDTITIDSLGITNHGWGAADSVLAILRTEDALITIIDSLSSVGEIPGLTEIVSSDPFVFCVGDNVPSQFDFTMIMRDRFGREWSQAVDLDPPYPPDSLWASSFGPDFVNLCWDYAGFRPADLLGYNLYRSISPTTEFTKANPFIIQGVSVYEDAGLASYTDYYYTVTAVDSSANESPGSDTICVRTNPPYQAGWPQAIDPMSSSWSSPAVGDLDGDGDLEVVISSGKKVYAWHHNGLSLTGWPIELTEITASSPALADLDGDLTLEVVICGGENDSVYAWKCTGARLAGWPAPTQGAAHGHPTIADIDLDGSLEIMAGGASRVYAWHSNGDTVAGWPFTTTGDVHCSPAVGNLDTADVELEIVFGCDNESLYVVNHDGSLLWSDALGGAAKTSSPALGDLDCDGNLEVVTGGGTAPKVCAWRSNGEVLPGWPQDAPGGVWASPALADLDGDDSLDVVVGTHGCSLYAWNHRGEQIFAPIYLGPLAYLSMSPAVGDLDADDSLEILVGCWDYVFYSNDRLHVFNIDTTELEGFPIFLSGRSSSSPALADLDQDGDLEILMGSSEERMYVWDLPTVYDPDNIEWAMFHHDRWHTGNYHWQMDLQSSSALATAYNSGRNLCRVPNTDDLWLAYQSKSGVYAARSEDGGKSWVRPCLGNGGFPTIGITSPEQAPAPPPYPVVVWTAPEPNPTELWCARLWGGEWQVSSLYSHPSETPHLPSMVIHSYQPYRSAFNQAHSKHP